LSSAIRDLTAFASFSAASASALDTCPSEVIGGHRRSSEVIRGHQPPLWTPAHTHDPYVASNGNQRP
jgi:hypothetical protein